MPFSASCGWTVKSSSATLTIGFFFSDASESAARIYDYLEANIDPNDKLFVCRLAGDAALADGFSDEGAAWLERIL